VKLPPCLKTQAHKLNEESERNEMEKEKKEEGLLGFSVIALHGFHQFFFF
jgi:hypothetical protein